jgi:glycosyltransferase involved in cell wall biosynthesis
MAEFIRRSIDSVLGQGYPDLELLVVDGASSDGTIEILNSYGDRIKWLSEPDTGQSDAINKGMGRVTGDILGYLNSDDILLPDAIEKVVAYFAGHPECDMVYGDADLHRQGRVHHRRLSHCRVFVRAADERLLRLPAGGVLAEARQRADRPVQHRPADGDGL